LLGISEVSFKRSVTHRHRHDSSDDRLYGSLWPYHSANIQADQLQWGTRMYRYSTEKLNGNWQGIQYQVPVDQRTSASSLPAAVLAGDWRALPPILNHMAVGLIHDSPGPYVASASALSKRCWAFVSTLVVCLGGFGMVILMRDRSKRTACVATVTLLALSLLYTAFVATEARFGILGFAPLTIAGSAFLTAPFSLGKKMLLALSALPIYALVLQWLAWLDSTRQLL
jgi:hypothetical protein